MRLTIDDQALTVLIEGETTLGELIPKLQAMLPNWQDYKILTTTVVSQQMIVQPYNPFPIYPTYPEYPYGPYYDYQTVPNIIVSTCELSPDNYPVTTTVTYTAGEA